MTQANPTDPRELIAFRISDQDYCVDIRMVREIRGWTPATPLPQSPDYVQGVINLRGAVLPIIDLSRRLGFGAPRHHRRPRRDAYRRATGRGGVRHTQYFG